MTLARSLLLTGGSGSFGQAFTRHLLEQPGVERVCVLSRDEAKQAAMRQALPDPRLRFFIGDVRDRDRLYRAMQEVEVVIHAAALKRVEVAEFDAAECAKTNVLGTMNVIAAATDAQVGRVVFLSTDKACAPLNAYGASKLLAEKLVLAAENARGKYGPHFAVTRYGNVAGSRGSVIPLWKEAASRGELLTITDPDCTRYYMTMGEAVALVDWTIRYMAGGELVVPDLPAYRVGDLAEAIGGRTHVTGMRPGEKKHELMIGYDEYQAFEFEGPFYLKRPTAPQLPLDAPHTSETARRLTVDQLREMIG